MPAARHEGPTSFDTAASAQMLVAAILWLALASFALAAETKNVLVIYSNNRLLPGNVLVDRGLRAAFSNPAERPVRVYSEFLDRPEFSGDAYERTMLAYLRDKYAARPPDAVISVSDDAFDFLLHQRSQLFPGVPLVYAVVSRSFLQSMPTVPVDAVGVPIEYDYAGTIEQALRWHPGAQRLVIVTGSSERDREREARLRREIPSVAGSVAVEHLAGLPTSSVLKRLGELDAGTVVFTPGYFEDGEGRQFTPRDSAALMAAASNAPMYGPVDTFIGTGIVGGRMQGLEAMGRQSARIVEKLFAGASPASLRSLETAPTALHVDWRQIERWGIDEKLIPADTVVHFREPTLWEAYRNVAILTVAIVLLQAALITKLLIERRRRLTAEVAVQKQRTELAHASRLAVAGELTASIAHEINQPLGAVQTSADAADLLLQSGGDRRDDLVRIVTRIRRDNLRASDVIRRLRALLARHEPERLPFDLNAAVGDVATLLRAEALRRGVTLETRSAPTSAFVVGDHTQIQQVLINLVLNAMDTVAGASEDRRTVVVAVEKQAKGMSVVVRDRGAGIAPEHMSKLFDSFFSTKQRGMGLGLSIARTIVEAHGGRIWAENGAAGGAAFHVELPEAGGASVAPSLT